MFISIECKEFDEENERNVFVLQDTCFTAPIFSPNHSPSMIGKNISNPITLYTIIKYYQSINKYIPTNVAHYYNWLINNDFMIDKLLIKNQLLVIDKNLRTNFYKPYFTAIIAQLRYKFDRLNFKFKKPLPETMFFDRLI